jgi:hypothetical protein
LAGIQFCRCTWNIVIRYGSPVITQLEKEGAAGIESSGDASPQAE